MPDSEEHTSLPQNIAFAFGILLSDLTSLLEKYEGALENMKSTFQFIATIMKSKAYYALLCSKHYKKIKSVKYFFLLLAKYCTPVDCSLLNAVVKATHCQPAIERLQAFLCSRDVDEEMTKLMQQSQIASSTSEASLPAPTVTSSQLLNDAPTKRITEKNTATSSLHFTDKSESPSINNREINVENSAISIQPQVQPHTLNIHVKVAQNSLTLAEYEHKTDILCGALRIPRSFLQLLGLDPGSVIIKWVTSEGLLPYLKSRVIRDADLLLLLKESLVSIKIGSEYSIQIGNPEFWTKV